MSLSSGTTRVKLKIKTEEQGTEIFLLDDQSYVKARAVDSLETEQPPGVYRIRLRAGNETRDEFILMRGASVERSYPALAFYSPIPLAGTSGYRKEHAEAAARLSREAMPVAAGAGGWLFFFARDCRAGAKESAAGHPLRGLSLKTTAGKTLVNLEKEAEAGGDDEPWAGCAVEVDPGLYVLRLETPKGAVFEQGVHASKDWFAHVFLTQRADGGADEEGPAETQKVPDLPGASMLLSKGREFRADDPGARLVELARLGLVNGRCVLAGELRQMLREKFEHPLLGIYGAHLLLAEKEFDAPLFREVIANLRGLFPEGHPDVEALALAAEEEGADKQSAAAGGYVFDSPPLLRRSWKLVVRRSAKRPDLIPFGSPASRVAEQMLGSEPWLTWMPQAGLATITLNSGLPSSGGEASDVRTDLEALLDGFFLPHDLPQLSLPAPLGEVRRLEHVFYTKLLGYGLAVIANALQYVSTHYGNVVALSAAARTSELHFDEEQIGKLVESLGLPRHNVEHLLYANARRLRERLDEAPAQLDKDPVPMA